MGNAPEARAPAEFVKEVISALVKCFSCTETAVVSMAVDGLEKILAKITFLENLKIVDDLGVVLPPLKDLMECGAWENDKEEASLLERISGVLFHYTQFGERGVDMLLQANILPSLMTLLTHCNNEVQTKTIILVFGMIHKGSKEDVIPAILESGFLDRVPELLGVVSKQMLKEYTFNSLACIIDEGNQEQFEKVTHSDCLPSFLPSVLQNFESGNAEMKLEASNLLVKLWENALKHGFSVEDITTRLAPYNITENVVKNAKVFFEEEQQAIIFMKFARALGLNR